MIVHSELVHNLFDIFYRHLEYKHIETKTSQHIEHWILFSKISFTLLIDVFDLL